MRAFSLYFLAPVSIILVGLVCEIWMHVFGIRRNWSFWRLKISILLIQLATIMICVWYILSIVSGRICV